jgi:hypothetical protein
MEHWRIVGDYSVRQTWVQVQPWPLSSVDNQVFEKLFGFIACKMNDDIHTAEHYSVITRNEVLIYGTTLAEFSNIHEVKEARHKRPHCVLITLLWSIQKRQIRRDRTTSRGCQGLRGLESSPLMEPPLGAPLEHEAPGWRSWLHIIVTALNLSGDQGVPQGC